MKESSQKKLFKAWAKKNNVVAEKIWGKVGTSDIWGCAKGKFFSLEFKDTTSAEAIKPTRIQIERIYEVLRSGGRAYGASLSRKMCYVKKYLLVYAPTIPGPVYYPEDTPDTCLGFYGYTFGGWDAFAAWFLEEFR